MKRSTLLLVLVLLAAAGFAQTAPDTAELTRLLKEFLAGASRNDAAVHDRFWADDVVYTRSSGKRVGKAEIMRDVRAAPAPKPGDPTTTYSAEDIRIQQYGDTAIVAFRLVGKTKKDGATQIANFLNTGTFRKRDGKWQAVSWQATRMPKSEEEAKNEVAAAEAMFHRAMRTSDVKTLENLIDDSFIWTQQAGDQITKKRLLDDLASGTLKYSRLDTSSVKISISGDTAVVRGESRRQRSAFAQPNATSATPLGRDIFPFTAFYTLTFVNQGGDWKAVAMHSSRGQ